jgi:hypothetical protein
LLFSKADEPRVSIVEERWYKCIDKAGNGVMVKILANESEATYVIETTTAEVTHMVFTS